MPLTLDRLRSLTTQAHARAEAARTVAEQTAQQKAKQRAKRHRLLADQIIERIELRAEKAALREERECVVLRLRTPRDFCYTGPVRPDTLTGVARLVWDDLAHLPLTLREWDDGVGMKGGWDMVLQW